MRTIPRQLMPLDCSVRVPVESTYGGEYAEPVEMHHVRFDQGEALARRDIVLSDGSRGLLFVDAVTTEGAFEIPVGSLVTIDGEELSAVKATRFETFLGHVHHWEVELA